MTIAIWRILLALVCSALFGFVIGLAWPWLTARWRR